MRALAHSERRMSAVLTVLISGVGLVDAAELTRLSDELAALNVDTVTHGGPDLAVLAVGAGLEGAVRRIRADGFRRVLGVTTEADASAWQLLAAGASDVISCDDQAAGVIEAKLRRWAAIDSMLASDLVRNNLVGRSRAWLDALQQLVEIALFSTKSVLITGESGTGKEMAARLVHTLDPRPDKGKLVTLDCTTIVPSLSGSELFGHAKGAFTGASSDRRGAFALAHGGTLFLDEVGELPGHLQSELLRVIQEGSYKPVGSDRWEHTEFRLVCATNRDLLAMQASGAFRSDLYHRITATMVRLPSLRDRVLDLLPLASHFLAAELGDDAPLLSPMVENYLVAREYPGNVRDLKQLIARMCCRHVGPGPLTVGDIPDDERPQQEQAGWWADVALVAAVERAVEAGAPLRELKETVAELAVDAALASSEGNVAFASRRLQVTERAVQMRRAARRVAEGPSEPRLSVMA